MSTKAHLEEILAATQVADAQAWLRRAIQKEDRIQDALRRRAWRVAETLASDKAACMDRAERVIEPSLRAELDHQGAQHCLQIIRDATTAAEKAGGGVPWTPSDDELPK